MHAACAKLQMSDNQVLLGVIGASLKKENGISEIACALKLTFPCKADNLVAI